MPYYSQRDTQIAQLFSEMQKKGLTEQEITVYSFAYFQNNEIHFFATNKYPFAFSFRQYCSNNNLLPTTINKTSYFKLCYADELSQVFFKAKIEAIKELNEIYPIEYFQCLQEIMPPVCNIAYNFLNNWLAELEGVYDNGALSLFEYACQLAFNWKIIDELHLDKLLRRVKHIYTQIDDFTIDTSLPSHWYAAFAYINKSQQIQYKIGIPSQIIPQHTSFLVKELFVSPVYQKVYYFSPISFEITRKYKDEFKQEIKHLLNKDYFSKLFTLRKMVPLPDKEKLLCYHSHPIFNNSLARQNFQLYANNWNFA